jgi:hypothetical protein
MADPISTEQFVHALAECEDDAEFRRSVPPDGRAGGELVERLGARLQPAAVSRRMRERFVSTRRPVLDGQLAQIRALDGLTVETPLERRPTVVAELAEDGDGVSLAFEGRKLVFPAHAGPDVAFAASVTGTFTARDLPGSLDDEGCLVLVRRLVREGFLRLTDATERGARA